MAFEEDYKATSAIAVVISAIGWLTLIGGLYFLFFSNEYSNYDFPYPYKLVATISVFIIEQNVPFFFIYARRENY